VVLTTQVARCEANFKENLGKGITEVDLHAPDDRHLVNFIDQNIKLDRIKRLDLATNGQTYTVIVNSKARFHNITEFKRGHRAVIDAIKHEFVTGILYTVFITGFVIGLIAGIVAGLKGANQMFYGRLVLVAIGGALAAPIHSTMRDDEETKFDIDSIRLLAVRLFAIVLASGVIGVFGSASVGAAKGAIGTVFIGSLIAGALSRKAIKSIANATIFLGTAIAAIGGTVPGTISGAITCTAGVVAVTYDNLEAAFRTILAAGTFGETVKTVIMVLPREDAYAIVVGTILGTILNYYFMLGNGAVFGAPVGALIATAFYIKHPKVTDPIGIFYSIMIFLITGMFYLGIIDLVFGDGNTGAVGGLIFAVFIFILDHLPDDVNPLFNSFRKKIFFAAVGVTIFFLPIYITRLFTHVVDFLAPVGRTVLIAAIGGFLLAAVVNMVGLRLVNSAFTRFNDQSITAVYRVLRRHDISIILGALGAFVGTIIAFVIELIAGEKLTGSGVAMAAIFGATTAIASGAITTVAMAIIMNITDPVITKMCTDQEIKTIIVIATVSTFIGGICGGYFTSSIMAGIRVALASPVVTIVMYTASMYAERRHCFKRVNWVPLVRVMNKFGIELRNLTSKETQNNWIRYKIAKIP
jgi:MFS family permease